MEWRALGLHPGGAKIDRDPVIHENGPNGRSVWAVGSIEHQQEQKVANAE
jgi:hypothetical protein